MHSRAYLAHSLAHRVNYSNLLRCRGAVAASEKWPWYSDIANWYRCKCALATWWAFNILNVSPPRVGVYARAINKMCIEINNALVGNRSIQLVAKAYHDALLLARRTHNWPWKLHRMRFSWGAGEMLIVDQREEKFTPSSLLSLSFNIQCYRSRFMLMNIWNIDTEYFQILKWAII